MRIGNMMQIVLFIGFLVTGAVMTLFIQTTVDSSETENRKLASFPTFSVQTIKDGSFFRQLENYTADHIGFRDSLVHSSTFITSLKGMPSSDSAFIVSTNSDNTGEAQSDPPANPLVQNTTQHTLPKPSTEPSPLSETSPSTEPSPLSEPPPSTEPPPQAQPVEPPLNPPSEEEKGTVLGKVLIVGDRAMNLFKYNAAAGQAYADVVNQIQAHIDQAIPNTVQTSVLLAPTAAGFIQSSKLKTLSDSQKDAFDEVYAKISDDITKIDALSAMDRHVQEELFFRTDHHWTANGAYYAYAAFIEAKGMTPVPLADYEKNEVPDFLGSLYSSTLNRRLADNPDTIVYYKPFVEHQYYVHYAGALKMPLIDLSHATKQNKYRIFMSGDRPWGRITTETDNDRVLMVIKDSYGNALIPFLLPHYKEILVVDPRQFDQPLVPFIQKHNIKEILYVNNAGVITNQGFAKQLRKMIPEE